MTCVRMILCVFCLCCWVVFFFFKQKTAYEMRISDWSSDVCSSDLLDAAAHRVALRLDPAEHAQRRDAWHRPLAGHGRVDVIGQPVDIDRIFADRRHLQAGDDLEAVIARVGLVDLVAGPRSEESQVGEEGVSTCRSWW